MRSLPDPPTLRAAWWALRAARGAQRDLRDKPLHAVVVPDPPALPPRALRGVRAVLRRRRPTCLERSLVLQRWLAAHGDRRDVIIGVRAPGSGFVAHAWLDGETPGGAGGPYHELTRLAP